MASKPFTASLMTEYGITQINNDMDPYENWDVGEIVGFSLGRVSEDILPLLLQYAPDHVPEKKARMRSCRSGVVG